MFLTGEEEIENACKTIKEEVAKMQDKCGNLLVIPLYSSLPPQMQQRIFDAPPGINKFGYSGRKCIVSTNIAETSLTIDGIVYVVDPGFSKQKIFNPRMRVESLLVSPISKASAKQRAGRAGRTKPGKCFRLYTEKSYDKELEENTYPEILRSNLSSTVLTLKKLGIEDLVHFDFMDPPAPETLMRALEQLNYLEALDDEGKMTETGVLMSEFPLEPHLAKVLINSPIYNCSEESVSLVALLSVPNIFLRPKESMRAADDAKAKFYHSDGDHLTALNAYQMYLAKNKNVDFCKKNFLNPRSLKQVDDIREQLRQIMVKKELRLVSMSTESSLFSSCIRKCIMSGFFMQIAHLQRNGAYMTFRDFQVVALHPSSILSHKPDWVLYNDLVLTKKNYLRMCIAIEGEWLLEIAPDYFNPRSIKYLDTKKELEKIERKVIEDRMKRK